MGARSALPAGAALAVALLAAACTDGVSPDGFAGPVGLAFALESASGASAAESEALGEAFDKVDRYQVRIVDQLSGAVYFDDVVEVTVGAATHVIEVELPEEAIGKIVDVELVALQGQTELFRSEVELTVTGSTDGDGLGGGGTRATVEIRYTGPGLRGGVTDAAGVGLDGIDVELRQNGATLQTTTTGEDGSFLFTNLGAGEYVVRPSVPDGRTACPSERTVSMSAGDAQVAAFLVRTGECITRLLVLSGGDVDDTEIVAALFTGLADVSVDRFFVVNAAPTLEELRAYDVVLLFQNGLFQESVALGDELVRFTSLGGNLVLGSFFWQGRSDGGAAAKGWGSLEALDPFASAGGATYEAGALGTVASHELTAGLTALTSTGLWGGVTAKTGTTVAASWADGTPLVGYTTGSVGQRHVAVSLFPAHSSYCCVTGDHQVLWQNAVRWAGLSGGPARSGVMAGGP